jgi:hypothetical protein
VLFDLPASLRRIRVEGSGGWIDRRLLVVLHGAITSSTTASVAHAGWNDLSTLQGGICVRSDSRTPVRLSSDVPFMAVCTLACDERSGTARLRSMQLGFVRRSIFNSAAANSFAVALRADDLIPARMTGGW